MASSDLDDVYYFRHYPRQAHPVSGLVEAEHFRAVQLYAAETRETAYAYEPAEAADGMVLNLSTLQLPRDGVRAGRIGDFICTRGEPMTVHGGSERQRARMGDDPMAEDHRSWTAPGTTEGGEDWCMTKHHYWVADSDAVSLNDSSLVVVPPEHATALLVYSLDLPVVWSYTAANATTAEAMELESMALVTLNVTAGETYSLEFTNAVLLMLECSLYTFAPTQTPTQLPTQAPTSSPTIALGAIADESSDSVLPWAIPVAVGILLCALLAVILFKRRQ